MNQNQVISLLCLLAVSTLSGSSAKPTAPEMERVAKEGYKRDGCTKARDCCMTCCVGLALCGYFGAAIVGPVSQRLELMRALQLREQVLQNPQWFYHEINQRHNDAKKNK